MDDVAARPTYGARANTREYEAIRRLGPDALALLGGPTGRPDVVVRFPYQDRRRNWPHRFQAEAIPKEVLP